MSTTPLFLIASDTQDARELVEALRQREITEAQINLVARSDVELEELPEADLTHESDVINAAKRGSITGAGVGLLAGIGVVAFGPAGLAIGGSALSAAGALAGFSAGGAAFGTWASTMVGVSIPNTDYENFQKAIDAGQILIMVDLESERQASRLRESLLREVPESIEQSRVGAAA
ncbi:hypothetical protein [Gilvimarinus algae]|uniref:DUF1269 domain-containing protein n=1 Tax=Gilvimarinus algae TaxID=3058037 RepID=A0ABT8TDB9_9GAMM|nr:hypothetical protein [Gilvimarinus sp. SDUM040014]MDO3382099.1 hypothetical protein [Gilvimarinus sp. SDUM040014]